MMDGFERRRKEKEDAILHAALELFKQYGFNKVRITDIACKASVSQVSIYNFFGSKEDLKKQLLMRLWETHYQKMMSVFESNETIQSKIEKLFLEVADNSLNFTMNFIREDFSNQLKNRDNLIPTQIKNIENGVSALLEQGKKEGVIKNAISTDALMNCIDIFRYYFMNNSEAATNFSKNPVLLREIISLYKNALFESSPGINTSKLNGKVD